jgi:hypothetical protein
MNPYIENKKVLDTLRSSQTPLQFKTSKKLVLDHVDSLDAIIGTLEAKWIKKADDRAYIEQLKHLRTETLRLLREKSRDLEVE